MDDHLNLGRPNQIDAMDNSTEAKTIGIQNPKIKLVKPGLKDRTMYSANQECIRKTIENPGHISPLAYPIYINALPFGQAEIALKPP